MEIEKYINRIISICDTAKPNQTMMFDNFGKYILQITKDENYVEDTKEYNLVDIAVYQKNAVKRQGRYKDVLVGDEIGVHITDMYRILKGIENGTRKLEIL